MGNRRGLHPREKHGTGSRHDEPRSDVLPQCRRARRAPPGHDFFEDREPLGPYTFAVPARRTHHVRFNNLKDPEEIPRDTAYSSLIESDEPVVVQHTRLDSRQEANALLSTIAYPVD